MGQKVSPIGFRIGINEAWRSRWYANRKNDFARYLLEDQRIRKYVKKHYYTSNISQIEIERTREKVHVVLHTARAGMIIGRKGSNVDKIKSQLEQFVADREVSVDIKEVLKPNVNAQLVAENIADQLAKRANFRRTIKKVIELATEAGAPGVKIQIAGRLAGAEMARTESAVFGKVPLQTLDAHVDYGFAESHTTYGIIGIKVWIYLGHYGQEVVTDGANAKKSKISKKPAR